MNASVWLGLAVIFAALWSGLLLTVTTILHPIYAAQDATGFAQELGRFLPVARRSPTNYVLVVGLVVTPVLALIGLWDRIADPSFVLTAVGFVLVLIGPLFTSRYLAEPNYDVILSWGDDAIPDDWRRVRRRYFALNWVRGACTWAALGCFAAAAWIELTTR